MKETFVNNFESFVWQERQKHQIFILICLILRNLKLNKVVIFWQVQGHLRWDMHCYKNNYMYYHYIEDLKLLVTTW